MEQIDSAAVKNRKWTGLIGALLLAITISLFLHSQSWRIADLDSLYHFRHAWIYRTQGFFDSSFPWVQYSVIKDAGADLWYGFHLLLMSFTYIKNPLLALKIASFITTSIGVLLVFFSLKKLGIKWPHLWTVLFIASSPDLFYRLSALRPQLLSFGLSFLFFAYFFKPTPNRRRNLAVFLLLSFASAWVHGALSWVNFVIFAVGSLVEKLLGEKLRLKEFLVMIGGTLIGFILRPHPLQGFKLLYIQLVQIFIEKYKETPLFWGTEVLHFDGRSFVDQFLPVVVLLFFTLFFLYRFYSQRSRQIKEVEPGFKAVVWTGFILAAIFFWLAFSSARRSADYFFGFTVMIIGLIFSYLFREKWKNLKGIVGLVSMPAVVLILIVTLYMVGFSIYRYERSLDRFYRVDRAREAAEWLAANSQTGDIVFHTRWDQLAELFFWNQKNYYINGMDPIFMYVANPPLYWKQHFFALDQASALTCGAVRCTQEEAAESYKVLKDDFKARYLYLPKKKSLNFTSYLDSDPRFEKVFENDEDVVFRVR